MIGNMIVDSHVHIVAKDQNRYPLQPPEVRLKYQKHNSGYWFQKMPVTAEELLQQMETAGVDRAILVQPYSAYQFDNSYAVDSMLRYPGRFVSLCTIDMLDSGAENRLSYWIQERGMSGLRIVMGAKGAGTGLDDQRAHRVWERAAALQIPVCIAMKPEHIPGLQSLLKRFPTVPVALDHLAWLFVEDRSPDGTVEEFFDLAEFTNLFLKFSTLNLCAPGKELDATHQEFLQRVINHFGVRRLMWSSNFPVSHDRGYERLVRLAGQAISFLPEEEQQWVLGKTALILWPALR